MEQDHLIALLIETTVLKRLPRTGWLLRGVPDAESIADHSFGTAFVVLALADVLNASGTLPAPLDAGKALAIAVLHDLPEARLTDLPGPTQAPDPARRSRLRLRSRRWRRSPRRCLPRAISERSGESSRMHRRPRGSWCGTPTGWR